MCVCVKKSQREGSYEGREGRPLWKDVRVLVEPGKNRSVGLTGGCCSGGD